ncbi:MAG: DUF6249 domain-containing protein [Chloroflexota bacterium]
MNDALEVLVPAFAVCMIFAVIFGFFAFVRYLRYKETIALAERGLLRPDRRRRRGRQMSNTLRWGIVTFITGIGFTIGLSILDSDIVFPGIVAMFFGLSLVVVHFLSRGEEIEEIEVSDETEDPIPPHKM